MGRARYPKRRERQRRAGQSKAECPSLGQSKRRNMTSDSADSQTGKQWWTYQVNAKQTYGPADQKTIEAWIEERRLSEQDYVAEVGSTKWIPVEESPFRNRFESQACPEEEAVVLEQHKFYLEERRVKSLDALANLILPFFQRKNYSLIRSTTGCQHYRKIVNETIVAVPIEMKPRKDKDAIQVSWKFTVGDPSRTHAARSIFNDDRIFELGHYLADRISSLVWVD